MLEIKNLSVSYGHKKILSELNIEIPKGEIHALIGPSGSGKSTLLKAIAGIKNISSGNIILNGVELFPIKHVIGYIPQDFGLHKWKSVYENIIIGANIKKVPYENAFDEIIEELGLYKLLNSYPSELSGGEKQRVAIARALLIKPDILLMDEPFSSLDSYTKENASNLLLHILKKHKITSLIVTHDIESAIYLGEKIIKIDEFGKIEYVKSNNLFGMSYIEHLDLYRDMLIDLKKVKKESVL